MGGYDLEGILNHIEDTTALVWLCNLNNPTGTYFSHDELHHFLEPCSKSHFCSY